MTSTFRDMIQRISVGWLLGSPTSTPDYIGARYLHSIGLQLDFLADKAVEGVRKRFPAYVAPGDTQPDSDALALLGQDRTIPQGPNESNTAYAIRLQQWIDDLKMSGNAFATLRQIQGYLSPLNTRLRLVNNWGVWYTLEADYSQSVVVSPLVGNIPNWNWDGRGPWVKTWEEESRTALEPLFAWSRFWPIIYCDDATAKPFAKGRKWGEGTWGSGWTWGSTATSSQVATIRAIAGQFKSGHSRCENIILAFDPASFDPTGPNGSPLPDGTWGRWANPTSSPFGGQQARLNTARYWSGPP